MEEELFKNHLKSGSFQLGLDQGKWGYPVITWPNVIIWIKAREIQNKPDRYYFRFDLTGYSSDAPTACPWNFEEHSPLSHSKWPKGSGNLAKVFNPNWNATALYAPCDRVAMQGHGGWKTQHKGLFWESSFTIVVYLEFLFNLLNSNEYSG